MKGIDMSEKKESMADKLHRRLGDVHASAHIKERPFTSDKPIVGRFIRFFREAWNSVAAKWYVRPMLHQQNEFNQAAALMFQELVTYLDRRLDETDRHLRQIEEQLISIDRDLTLVARKVAEGEYRVRHSNLRMSEERSALLHRLSGIEEALVEGNGVDGEQERRGRT